MEAQMTGSCFCGAVRYRLTSAPMFVHCCHCLDCQKQTGGAFAINAIIERDRIELLSSRPKPIGVKGAVSGEAAASAEASEAGPIAEAVAVTMPTDSGRPHDIYRCPRCATALWSDYGRRGVLAFLRVSTLDAPHAIVPDVHIFTRSKVPWVRIPEGARAFEVYYDMKKEWPAESLARREALLGQGR
jgi:hypothetical protein